VSDLATFGHLSRVLTGERSLAEDLVALNLARLRGDTDAAPVLGRLLEAFARCAAEPGFDEEAFRQEVTPDPELGPLVRRIVVLWITGALPKVDYLGRGPGDRLLPTR
jgi:hypothetical protein